MQRPLEIRCHELDLSEGERTLIHDKAHELERFCPDLVGCDVFAEGPGGHHREGGPYGVHVRLNVPDQEIAISRQESAILHDAIAEAFSAARRRLQDYVRERRGSVKHHEPATHGSVVRLLTERDCGFLETDDGREVYFHRNAVLEPGYDHMAVGDRVRFAEEQGDEGPQASSLIVVSHS